MCLTKLNLSKNHRVFTYIIFHLFIPRNIQEALDDHNWKATILKEMNALRKISTWEIVDLPKDKKNCMIQMGVHSEV